MTEKAYESESYSETEDDFQATKQVPKDPFPARLPAGNKQDEKKSQKKPSSNANKGTKQASIVGFFQKKWWRWAVDIYWGAESTKTQNMDSWGTDHILEKTSTWTHPIQDFTFTLPAVTTCRT